MKTTIIDKNITGFTADTRTFGDVLATGNILCDEIRKYPIYQATLTGGFHEVCELIRQHIPVHSSPRGAFDLNTYVHPSTGQPIPGVGFRLLGEFEQMQKEILFEQTQGRINDLIVLERDAFLSAVKVKDGKPLLEAAHNFFALINENESVERISSLLFFKEGRLESVPDAEKMIEEYHTVYADPFQSALLEAVTPHFQALSDIAEKFESHAAIKSGLFANDLLWLLKVGDDGESAPADPEDDHSDDHGDIGGMGQDGRPRPGRNKVFQF